MKADEQRLERARVAKWNWFQEPSDKRDILEMVADLAQQVLDDKEE